MSEEQSYYSMDELREDLNTLMRSGLIEITGITDDGEWLYSATEKCKNLQPEEIQSIVHEIIYDED